MSNTCKLLVEYNTVLKETLIGLHSVNNNKAAESKDKPCIEFIRSIALSDGSKQCTPRNEVDSADYSHEIIY